MHVRQALEDAGGVEFDLLLGNAVAFVIVHDVEQLPSLHEIQQHEHALVIPVGVHELDHEGVIDLGHDLAFAAHALGLVVIDELAFDLYLEGVGLPGLSVGGEPHLSEGPRAEEGVSLELHDVDGSIELVHPLPVLLVAHATQVQNDAVDIRQGKLPQDAILENLHRLSTLLHPSLPPELLVLVRHERILPEERPRLENPALAIVRVRFQNSRSHEEERGSVDVIPLGQNLPLGRVLHLVDQRAH
mmetsp:Transcript_40642/g.85096  ORF Transcript_40642/g.85096 Transcript_40642/m.85096 type:complete len:245 (+) Transcript_40642:958-1692(+)